MRGHSRRLQKHKPLARGEIELGEWQKIFIIEMAWIADNVKSLFLQSGEQGSQDSSINVRGGIDIMAEENTSEGHGATPYKTQHDPFLGIQGTFRAPGREQLLL